MFRVLFFFNVGFRLVSLIFHKSRVIALQSVTDHFRFLSFTRFIQPTRPLSGPPSYIQRTNRPSTDLPSALAPASNRTPLSPILSCPNKPSHRLLSFQPHISFRCLRIVLSRRTLLSPLHFHSDTLFQSRTVLAFDLFHALSVNHGRNPMSIDSPSPFILSSFFVTVFSVHFLKAASRFIIHSSMSIPIVRTVLTANPLSSLCFSFF